jgi:choline dehydrogenase-like flavoprotein
MRSSEHYDVVIIGSGPGGGTMAWRLAQTGKRILLLERGGYLPRERENWDSQAVFVDARYQAKETWYSSDGKNFHPGLHYFVGGNSKVYGAVLLRLRERDFDEITHADGISPEWPLKYDAFEPYYQAAEELYYVHGLRGEDPTEPASKKPYAYPPITHEPVSSSYSMGSSERGTVHFICRSAFCSKNETAERCRTPPASAAMPSTAIHV